MSDFHERFRWAYDHAQAQQDALKTKLQNFKAVPREMTREDLGLPRIVHAHGRDWRVIEEGVWVEVPGSIKEGRARLDIAMRNLAASYGHLTRDVPYAFWLGADA